ncbi:MAG TPA: inositol monophosphatase family protein [Pseudonocardia sp.]|jgi:myo-inositol-1(or 4)-monophosphatase|nr:inositol monophosphatase family protein [Pseudonocardia sp.]
MDGAVGEPDPEQLRGVAVRVAKEAAQVAAGLRAGAISQVRTKSSATDPVTEADTATEELLRRRLAELRPADAVLGEEAGLDADGPGVAPGQLCWLVDPIDGTVNYVYGLPWYAVSVGVARDGVALAGAVVEPASGRVWSASDGGGASLDGTPLRASSASRLALALIGTGFSYAPARRARQGALAGTLLARVRDIRRAGAASLDLCAVAAGWLDGYYEHAINPWDWAAGALIAREAGAIVHPPDPAAPYGDAILAAAPGIQAELAGALAELGGAGI